MRRMLLPLFLLLALAATLQAAAQDAAPMAEGLFAPRHIAFAEDGTLYIAEAGAGGDIEAEGPFGTAGAGATGAVTAVRPDGSTERVLHSLPSLNWGGGEIVGTHALYPAEDAFWLLQGNGDRRTPYTYALVELDPETLRVRQTVDLYAFEVENNPDGEIIDSNPVDLAVADDGTVYIADAGANAVLSWTEEDGVSLFATWSDNPVPTSVAVDPAGDVYIGFLTGFPFPSEGSRIEKYSADGELLETFSGLSAVVDLLVDGESLYAVEFGQFGDDGWLAQTGRIVTVSADGLTIVAEGLTHPYGLAMSPDQQLYVVVESLPVQSPQSGRVIAVTGDSAAPASEPTTPPPTRTVPPPAATENAG